MCVFYGSEPRKRRGSLLEVLAEAVLLSGAVWRGPGSRGAEDATLCKPRSALLSKGIEGM